MCFFFYFLFCLSRPTALPSLKVQSVHSNSDGKVHTLQSCFDTLYTFKSKTRQAKRDKTRKRQPKHPLMIFSSLSLAQQNHQRCTLCIRLNKIIKALVSTWLTSNLLNNMF